jgi:hypothetical protein
MGLTVGYVTITGLTANTAAGTTQPTVNSTATATILQEPFCHSFFSFLRYAMLCTGYVVVF